MEKKLYINNISLVYFIKKYFIKLFCFLKNDKTHTDALYFDQ